MFADSKKLKIILSFLCIYLVWGSTYLVIKYAILGNSPFFVISLRFILGGFILFLIAQLRREKFLKVGDLKIAALSGCLLVLGNSLVAFAEKDISSGLAAVVVGSMPAWIMIFNWKFFNGSRPLPRQIVGVFISLLGVGFLSFTRATSGSEGSMLSWLCLFLSLIFWALGTLIQRKAHDKESFFTFSSIQVAIGGLTLLTGWSILGDTSQAHIVGIAPVSLWAILYLSLVGTVLAFSAYLWLNQNVEASTVSTYALVNPVVAVWLGWLILSEPVGPITIASSLVVVGGIYLIVIKEKNTKMN